MRYITITDQASIAYIEVEDNDLDDMKEQIEDARIDLEDVEIVDISGFGPDCGRTLEAIAKREEEIQRVERGGYEPEAYFAWICLQGVDYATVENFEDHFHGTFADIEEFVEDYIDNYGILDSIPEHLQYYFDTEKFGRDLMINDFSRYKCKYQSHFFRN